MNKKESYHPAHMDVTVLDPEDVITCSGELDEDTDPDQGAWDAQML